MLDGESLYGELLGQLGVQVGGRVEDGFVLGLVSAGGVRDGLAVLDPLLGQLQPVVGFGELEPGLAQTALPRQPSVLGGLGSLAAGPELLLRHPGLLPGLDETSL